MERCGFSSIMSIVRTYVSEDHIQNQADLLSIIFDDFLADEDNMEYVFDNGLVCRWMNGQAKISPQISTYYLIGKHQAALADTLSDSLLPLMYDSSMAIQKLYELILYDDGISEDKKEELTKGYPYKDSMNKGAFLSRLLIFGMSIPFIKRDAKTGELITTGNLSPAIKDNITNADVPKPCRYFCGRNTELETLHSLLSEKGKVFLNGIPGIGKSELAKAYAAKYKKEYTNILYLTYSGDLKQDIIDLDFISDSLSDSEDELFRKHNRFLRGLKADTLLIIDNFNTTATQDSLLSVVMKYGCQILFTTRSKFENYHSLALNEISDSNALLSMMGQFYKEADSNSDTLKQIIDSIHSHTLAVELSARLLGKGLITPAELLEKLRNEHTSMNASDKIGITKDGKSAKETYYGHIHTLFSLFLLEDNQQELMCSLSMLPLTGIPIRRLVNWLDLPDTNLIDELAEAGFVSIHPGYMVCLHPMIQEISITDLKPSVSNCTSLLYGLQAVCLVHGEDISYHKQLFDTVDNIMRYIENDEPAYYLGFLEDVFPYMEKYHYYASMDQILTELEILLSDKSLGSISDRALLLDYRAIREQNPAKALKLDLDALALIPTITAENALLVANLNCNIGSQYHKAKDYEKAKAYYETALSIMQEYNPEASHDSIAMMNNYAAVLCDIGEISTAMQAFRKLARLIKDTNSDMSADYANIQEALARTCLLQGDIKNATTYYKKAMAIYETIYADAPDLLIEKRNEIMASYPAAGIGLAQRLLSSYN